MRGSIRISALASTLAFCACTSCGRTSEPPGETWPTAAPEKLGLDSAALASMVERIDREELPIDSLLVARDGTLILDAYFYPYLGEQPHDIASVTKSVTSTLVGIAVDRGLLDLDEKVLAFFDADAEASDDDRRAAIELQHLLSMSSGFECGYAAGERELYEMLASDDYVRYALALPMRTTPGDEFAYCSPGSHLLSAMVSRASQQSTHDFAKQHLFGPIGIEASVWPSDPQGVDHGWGDLQLYPRDLARIGHLFLEEGAWGERQIVSASWVRRATRHVHTAEPNGTGYGYQWWILAGPFEGLYEARGRGGQAIIVWPDKRVVAVFTGRGVDVRGEIGPLLASALKSDRALEPNADAYARLQSAVRNAAKPPAPEPAPELPPTAAEVSGRAYVLGPNQFDVACVVLRFTSDEEVWFRLSGSRGTFDMPVGMDGVPRFSESGPTGIPVGITGEWSGTRTFELSYDEVAGPNHLEIQVTFAPDPDPAALTFTDPAGHFLPERVLASSAEACP